jgi:predicted dehydrogenase
MLQDNRIQAVYIPLPNGLHAEWMIKAAEKGKHSLSEKPFASNSGEAMEVARISSERGVYVMEGFMWRYHPQHLRVRTLIREGAIGRVQLVRSAFSFMMERNPNVRFVPDLAGGSVMDVGCYPISAARYYFEDEPFRAYARGDIDVEFGVDMRMSGILEFPGGRALIDCAFDLPYRTELEIVGDRGTIFVPKAWQPDPESTIVLNGNAEKLPQENHYIRQFEHFSQCILNRTAPQYGPDDAIHQMRVIDAVLRSMRSRNAEGV